MRKSIFTLLVFVIGISFLFAQKQVLKPTKVVEPVYHDTSPALRDIEPILPGIIDHKAWKESEFKKVPNQRFIKEGKTPLAPQNFGPDPVLQVYMGMNAAAAPIQNWEGIANINGVLPPDTDGDVGPNHYVQMVNLSFAVFNKSGTLLYGPVDNSTLWAGFTGPWTGTNDGDPIVLYDQAADRWLFSQFALPNYPNGPFYELIAISTTGDPLGSYYRYAFAFTDMCDYPKFGIWPDAYYMSINNFKTGTLTSNGVGAAAFERDVMLSGGAARMVYFQLSPTADPWSFLPSDWDGTNTPPAGAPNYFIYAADDYYWGGSDRLEIYEFHVDWVNTSNSTFIGPTALNTAPFDMYLCGATRDRCITQPGTSVMLEAIPDRLMFRLQYRNFGSYQAMVTNHTVDADGSGKAGIRWYELRNTGSGWSIYQQGTYSPDSDHRWMGSIAMDGQGNIGLGYSVSSSSTYPSIRYTGRYAGDPLGQMTFSEENIITGSGSQTHSEARWGDYSMMSIDPSNDRTFWYTQEYIQTTGSAPWRTRIASFEFALAPGPTISLSDDSLNFGTTYVGFPDTTIITIRNLGDENLNITNITTTNTEFTASPKNFTIGPGSFRDVSVIFNPTSSGSKSSTLTIVNNDSNVTVYCVGEGALPPDINVTPTSYNVTLDAGDSTSQTLTISNNGLGNLFFDITLQEGTPPLFNPFIIRSKDEVIGKNAQPLNNPYLLDIYSDFKTNSNPITIPFESNKITYDPGDIILTHSVSQSIISGNSVSCNSAGLHTDNSYWRSFDLNSFGIYSELNVKAVEIGIEQATSSGSGQPLTVNLYTSAGAFPGGARTLIGTTTVTVSDQSGTIISIPITASVPAGSELVVEIFTPDGQAVGNSFFIGSNNLGQTAPSYISASGCGVPTPTDLSSLGFPNMHIVMNVVAGISWLTLSDYSDTVNALSSKNINVKFNAKALFDGDYYNDIIIANNDPTNPEIIVPAHLRVNGIPNIAVSTYTMNFDSLFVGLSDSKVLTVSNIGTKTLTVSNITTTGNYTVDSTSLSIPPKQSQDINVTFTPTSPGIKTGALIITSNDPDESPLTVILSGVGVSPPIIGVNPTAIRDSLEVGDTSMHKLAISNTGQYNLIWQAAFIPDSSDIHRVQPLLNNSSITDPEVLTKLEKDKNNNAKGQKVVILRSPNSNTYSNEDFEGGVPPTGWTVIDNAGTGLVWTTISGSGESGNYCGTGGAATVSSDKFGTYKYDTELRTPNMNLSSYQDIYLTYDVNYQDCFSADLLDFDVSTDNGSNWTNILRWDEDHGKFRNKPGEQVAIKIEDYVSNLSSVMFRWRYYNPNASWDWYAQIDNVKIEGDLAIVKIDPSSGVVAPGLSDTMDVKFDARNLIGGEYFGHLGIQSNDPIKPLVDIPLYMNVSGIPDVALSTDSLKFGNKMVRGTYELTFEIQNKGTDWLDVTNIISNNSVFTVDKTNFKVRTSQPETVTVYFKPTATVDYNGTLTIFNNDSIVHVYLTGTGVPAPEISVTPDSLSETLNMGETVTRYLRISNSGSVNLDFTLSFANWSFGSPLSLKTNISVPKFTGVLSPDIDSPSSEIDMSKRSNSKILLSPNKLLVNNSIGYVSATTYGDYEYATFDVTTPGTFNIIEPDPTWESYAGDFAGDGEFYIEDRNDYNLYKIDTTDGTRTLIGSVGILFHDMAYDQTSDIMYALNATTGDIHTLNIQNGANTIVGNTGVSLMIAIAIDGDGNLWGYSVGDDNFYSINKSTGAATLIGPLGYNTNYAQSMDWDPISGNLFMAAYGGGLDGNLRIIDRNTGASTLVGSFNGGKEVTVLAFPSTLPWLSVDTTNGSIPPGGYVDIEVTFDANVRMGGDYFADIVISSNDPVNSKYRIPAHMHVIGVPTIVTSTDSLFFGDVYTGQTDTLIVEFMNTGTYTLNVTNITNTLSEFSTNLTSFNLEVGDTQKVEFYFTPTVTGPLSDVFIVTSNDTSNPSYQIYVEGNGTPGSGIEEEQLGIPKNYCLEQNFPNPFNPSTTIRFGLPEASTVSIIVYDILGREITRLFEGKRNAGFHRVVWNADVASGVYLFRIVAKSETSDRKFVDVKKMIFMK